ncbi:ExbD/TolR family protein [Sphingobium subterraneum]|nr:biopolymer transporter ExbD [Sphingobium subterraneum]
MGDMNTTPLIDVMLVLLIMFVITMPLQTHAVKMDLPSGPGVTVNSTKNLLTLDSMGTLRWNGVPIDRLMLRSYLQQSLSLPVEPELQFQPTADAHYVHVDGVMADIKRSGVSKVGFIGNEHYRSF